MNRRQFFNRCGLVAAKTAPFVGLIGMRFQAYSAATTRACGFSGTVTWFGRLIAFVPADGGKWFWFFGR